MRRHAMAIELRQLLDQQWQQTDGGQQWTSSGTLCVDQPPPPLSPLSPLSDQERDTQRRRRAEEQTGDPLSGDPLSAPAQAYRRDSEEPEETEEFFDELTDKLHSARSRSNSPTLFRRVSTMSSSGVRVGSGGVVDSIPQEGSNCNLTEDLVQVSS